MIVINPITRQFSIPSTDLVFGVEADSGSERKYFQCPRYVGNNLDIASSFVRINYRNANGEVDAYLVEDLTADENVVTFSWELHPKATMYKGQTSFVVCVTGPDAKLKWHTTMGRGQVLEGLEPDSAWIHEGTEDAIVQLITMVEKQTDAVEKVGAEQVAVVKAAAKAAEAATVAQVEAKGASTLATIPEDYTGVQNAVRGAANAIRGKASGEVIRVDDVSPMEHYPVVRVHGKNLIPFPYNQASMNVNGGTLTAQEDGGVAGSGTPTGSTSLILYYDKPLVHEGIVTFSLSGTYTNMIGVLLLEDSDGNTLYNKNVDPSLTVNLSDYPNATKMELFVKRKNNAIEMSGVVYPQLELGRVVTEYTPYIDPTTVTVTGCGKNILPYPLLTTGGTFGGVTVTSEDNTLILNGTVTKNTAIPLFIGNIRVKGRYTISGLSGGSGATYYLQPYIGDTTAGGTTDGSRTYEWDGVLTRLNLNVVTGATFNNLRVFPMVEYGDVMSGFETYKGETQIPAADGTVAGLKAISPTMTLLTDTPGVTIECEYNRDTNKVIEDLLNKITALGG